MSELIQGRFVVGMSWTSIVAKGDLSKLAKQKASKEKGNWYSQEGRDSSVGIAALPKKLQPPKGEHFISAGRMAGSIYGFGTQFIAVVIPEGEHEGKIWICGLDSGRPINGFDEIVSDLDALQRYEAFLQQRGVSEGQIGLCGNAPGMPQTIVPATWDEVVASQPVGPFAHLHPTVISFVEGLSPAKRAGIVVVMALIGLNVGWGEYKKWKAKRDAALIAAQQVDPVAAWQMAMATWTQTTMGPSGVPLASIRQGISLIPTSISDWVIREIACSLQRDGWTCLGGYSRKENLPLDPTTVGFRAAVPADWTVNPKSLEQIDVSFKIPTTQSPIQIDRLISADEHLSRTASEMQRASRAFISMEMSSFVPATVAAPVTNAGAPIPPPPGLSIPKVSSVRLAGPMRSLDLDEIAGLPVAWKSFKLLIKADSPQASLRDSSLTVNVQGDLYAK